MEPITLGISKIGLRAASSADEIKISYNHDILSSHTGNTQVRGQSAGKEKNHYWIVRHKYSGNEYAIMYCDVSTLTKVNSDKIHGVMEVNKSWFYHEKTGYVITHHESSTLHAFIMGHTSAGKGSLSVDHINRQKLDNRRENLRICNQSDQNRNMMVRKSKEPRVIRDGFTTNDLPKFITYNTEKLPSGSVREFFRIEKHPRQVASESGKKQWTGCKGSSMDIYQKFDEALKMLKSLNNGFDSREYDYFDANKFYHEEFERAFTRDEYIKSLHLSKFNPHYDEPTAEDVELYNKYVNKGEPLVYTGPQ